MVPAAAGLNPRADDVTRTEQAAIGLQHTQAGFIRITDLFKHALQQYAVLLLLSSSVRKRRCRRHIAL